MVDTGETVKFTPLPEDPIRVPPEAKVHHLILPDDAVAIKFELPLQAIVDGLAVTEIKEGPPETVTLKLTLELAQPVPFHAKINCPLPF